MRGITQNPFYTMIERQAASVGQSAKAAAADKEAKALSTAASEDKDSSFFGKDGATFGDLVDAINPLNHIPFVSGLFGEDGAPKVSPASKIIGGALLGGPVGLFAAVADAVFEEATGKGAAESMVAALTGDSAAAEIQVASAEAETPALQVASAAAPVTAVDVADAAQAAVKRSQAKLEDAQALRVASLSEDLSTREAKDKALLALYGSSAPSAHASYKKAQMLPYLKDVTTSQVL
jgi:hypothetical protein